MTIAMCHVFRLLKDPRVSGRHVTAMSATDVIRNAPGDDSGRIGYDDSAMESLIIL